MDVATSCGTRLSMAKVRVEIDLTKLLLTSVWAGQDFEDSTLTRFTQKIEYESIPKYCKHCRRLGHSLVQCRNVSDNLIGHFVY